MSDHERLIAEAAQAELAPLGCVRQGTSRTWIDDHGWWVGVVEFQPSSWSKGSYLNAGACWLWRETDHFSFDLGNRVETFRQFEDTDQFAKVARGLAARAAREVLKLRARALDIRSLAWRLRLKWTPTIWDHYHAAVSNGLAGRTRVARRRFARVSSARNGADWAVPLKEKALQLNGFLERPERFRQEVGAMIASSRERLGLARIEPSWFDA